MMYEMLRKFAQRLLDNNAEYTTTYEDQQDGRTVIYHDIVKDGEIVRICCDGIGMFESVEIIAC